MLDIYTLAGGEWLRGTFNAIAAFIGTQTWKTMSHMALLFSVLIVAVNWTRKHDVLDMVGWSFVLVFVSLMVIIRTPIQIIDNSNAVQIYEVDNVPVGLALPASLSTRIGHALVQSYETVFSQPDSVTYSKTGMLFGANLVARSTDFLSQNSQITTVFSDYVQNCVMGDIFLNHKYSLEDLMNSSDPYTLIFASPSPLRGLFTQKNDYQTCSDAAVELKSKLALDSNTGGKTWHYYVRQLFGGKPQPDLLFSQLLGDSYGYFYSSGQSASQIIRHNVTLNALRGGILSYASRNGDTASLLNIATTSSLEKQRLAHASLGQVALQSLPIMQTVLMGILVGLFPIMVMAGMFNAVTMSVVKGYAFTFLWLQTWPLLYAILNNAMTFYAKQNGAPVVLSELSRVQVKYSDIATTAGYISMMIPFLSWKMVMGLGEVFSSISSSLGSASLSSTSASSASVVDGNYSFANMQTENVTGYSWNTNSSTSFGQMTQQLANGATSTQTRDGGHVVDATGSMSKTPVDILITRSVARAQQRMARESESQAETAIQGYNRSVVSAWNALNQFNSHRGHSASVIEGADKAQNSQESLMHSKMWNAVTSNAKANHISAEQSFQNLMDKTSRGTASAEAYAAGRFSSGDQIVGRVGRLATGLSVEGGGRITGSVSGSSGSTQSLTDSGRQSHDTRHDISSQAARDFRESRDYLTYSRTSQSGNATENNSVSRVDQLAASLSKAKNSYDQYTQAFTRSQEYAQMASRTQSLGGQMNQNLTQQFSNFVRERAPLDADTLLTDAGSAEIVAKRENLAREFVRNQMAPRMATEPGSPEPATGEIMPTMKPRDVDGGIGADFKSNREIIEGQTQHAGIREGVNNTVREMIKNSQAHHLETENNIERQSKYIITHAREQDNDFDNEQRKYQAGYNNEKDKQGSLPGAKTKRELLDEGINLEGNMDMNEPK